MSDEDNHVSKVVKMKYFYIQYNISLLKIEVEKFTIKFSHKICVKNANILFPKLFFYLAKMKLFIVLILTLVIASVSSTPVPTKK